MIQNVADSTARGRAIPLHLAPVIIVGAGAFMVFASMFMPALASPKLDSISQNMMLQNHPVTILCPIAALIAGLRYWNIGSKSSANSVIYAGFWFFAWTIYSAYDAQLINGYGQPVETEAGVGLWTAGTGCLIIALGGLMMRYPHLSFGLITGPVLPPDEQSAFPDTKICPKCAERIKAAALVCRYCHADLRTSDSAVA